MQPVLAICFGACAGAPSMLVDETLHESVKLDQVGAILDAAKKSTGHH